MPSLILDRRRFGAASQIPAFVMRPQDRPEAPVVLYQHGYTGKKENDLAPRKLGCSPPRVSVPFA